MSLRQAAQQALEALESAKMNHGKMLLSDPPQEAWRFHRVDETLSDAITALRVALAEPEQEPVALTDGEILDANYPDGEEADPIIAAPDSELIAFSRAVMAVQRDKEGKPMAYWRGLIEPQKDAAAPTPRKPLSEQQRIDLVRACGFPKFNDWHDAAIGVTHSVERAHGIGEQHE